MRRGTSIQRRIIILYNVTLFQERSGSWGIFTKNPVREIGAFLGREQDFAKPLTPEGIRGGTHLLKEATIFAFGLSE